MENSKVGIVIFFLFIFLFTSLLYSQPAGIPKFSKKAELLFPNSDFEQGNLDNWRPFGKAFLNQPTYGDNVLAREAPSSALPQGTWWIGTYENYQGLPGQKAGNAQKNTTTGELISQSFTIKTPYIGFLVGGGTKNTTAVRLIVNGEVVREASGLNHALMRREFWDVKEFIGMSSTISIIDKEKGAWGCINADDFCGYMTPDNMLLFSNSDFELGDLSHWKGEGSAFDRQPTLGDNPAAREYGKHSNHQGKYWIGTYELYQGKSREEPGGVRKDVAFGTLRSEPFKIRGYAIWFLLGGGKGSGLEVRLYVDGKVVKTARNTESHEDMRPVIWVVSEYKGKDAEIEIIDDSMDAWGHINVDNFRYVRLLDDL
ncbi:MAG TPA: hypothetical protein PLX23_10865 [Candidatus Hydrogenedens sp.]|nr:hypothetical protein [Candidatus Hydrogenedens sp.]